MKMRVLPLLILGVFSVSAQAQTLPDSWIGKWKGECVDERIKQTLGVPGKYTMHLEIGAVDGKSQSRAWKIRYEFSEGNSEPERNYQLDLVDALTGHYRVDEKNGIKLDQFYADHLMSSAFVVNGRLFHQNLYLNAQGEIQVFATTFDLQSAQVTGGENGLPPVTAFMATGNAACALKKAVGE